MNLTLFGTIALSLSVLATPGCATSARPKQLESTSICKLVRSGEAANGKNVRIRAVFVTDMVESTRLIDPSCPGVGIAPYDANMQLQDRARLKRFEAALDQYYIDHKLRKFSYEVSGRFVWDAKARPAGSLYVEKVWSFEEIPAEP